MNAGDQLRAAEPAEAVVDRLLKPAAGETDDRQAEAAEAAQLIQDALGAK